MPGAFHWTMILYGTISTLIFVWQQVLGGSDVKPYQCFKGNGKDFKERRINYDDNGKPCKKWDDSSVQEHDRRGIKEIDGSLEHNYCRNPNGRWWKPWCFVEGKKLPSACPVPHCTYGFSCYADNIVHQDYRDDLIDRSISGMPCLPWSHPDIPKEIAEEVKRIDDVESDKLKNRRFCRNPNRVLSKPFCYIQSPYPTAKISMEECDLRPCQSWQIPAFQGQCATEGHGFELVHPAAESMFGTCKVLRSVDDAELSRTLQNCLRLACRSSAVTMVSFRSGNCTLHVCGDGPTYAGRLPGNFAVFEVKNKFVVNFKKKCAGSDPYHEEYIERSDAATIDLVRDKCLGRCEMEPKCVALHYTPKPIPKEKKTDFAAFFTEGEDRLDEEEKSKKKPNCYLFNEKPKTLESDKVFACLVKRTRYIVNAKCPLDKWQFEKELDSKISDIEVKAMVDKYRKYTTTSFANEICAEACNEHSECVAFVTNFRAKQHPRFDYKRTEDAHRTKAYREMARKQQAGEQPHWSKVEEKSLKFCWFFKRGLVSTDRCSDYARKQTHIGKVDVWMELEDYGESVEKKGSATPGEMVKTQRDAQSRTRIFGKTNRVYAYPTEKYLDDYDCPYFEDDVPTVKCVSWREAGWDEITHASKFGSGYTSLDWLYKNYCLDQDDGDLSSDSGLGKPYCMIGGFARTRNAKGLKKHFGPRMKNRVAYQVFPKGITNREPKEKWKDVGEIIFDQKWDADAKTRAAWDGKCEDHYRVFYGLSGQSCYTGKGDRFTGRHYNYTDELDACIKWDDPRLYGKSDLPSKDTFKQDLLESSDHNYCRNVGGDGFRPWCYTLGKRKKIFRSFCPVPKCVFHYPYREVAKEQCKTAQKLSAHQGVGKKDCQMLCNKVDDCGAYKATGGRKGSKWNPLKRRSKKAMCVLFKSTAAAEKAKDTSCFTKLRTGCYDQINKIDIPKRADVPFCPRTAWLTCFDGTGENYGDRVVSMSEELKKCKIWEGSYKEDIGERLKENADHNYCRWIKEKGEIGCFVESSSTNWQKCGIAQCMKTCPPPEQLMRTTVKATFKSAEYSCSWKGYAIKGDQSRCMIDQYGNPAWSEPPTCIRSLIPLEKAGIKKILMYVGIAAGVLLAFGLLTFFICTI